MREVSRRFGDLVANDRVSFDVGPGEIHALLGENGAGKSTLMRMLSGYLQPDSGTIHVGGREVRITDPAHALELGIGMVHQHSVLVPELTVAENIMLGQQSHWLARYSKRDLNARVREICERTSLDLDPRTRLSDLSADQVQQVEIAGSSQSGV